MSYVFRSGFADVGFGRRVSAAAGLLVLICAVGCATDVSGLDLFAKPEGVDGGASGEVPSVPPGRHDIGGGASGRGGADAGGVIIVATTDGLADASAGDDGGAHADGGRVNPPRDDGGSHPGERTGEPAGTGVEVATTTFRCGGGRSNETACGRGTEDCCATLAVPSPGVFSYACIGHREVCGGIRLSCATSSECSGDQVCCHIVSPRGEETVSCVVPSMCKQGQALCAPSDSPPCSAGENCVQYGRNVPYFVCK